MRGRPSSVVLGTGAIWWQRNGRSWVAYVTAVALLVQHVGASAGPPQDSDGKNAFHERKSSEDE